MHGLEWGKSGGEFTKGLPITITQIDCPAPSGLPMATG